MKNHIILLFLLTFLTLPFNGCLWTGWFSDSKDKHGSKSKDTTLKGHNLVAEFPVHGLDYPKEVELPENAKSNLRVVNPCWFNAHRSLFSTCKDLAAEEKRSRLPWLLSDCFQQDTGRNSFPSFSRFQYVEILVNDLKDLALSTEEKLGTLEEKSNDRLPNSNQIRESIVSIDAETRRLGQELKKIVDEMGVIEDLSTELNNQQGTWPPGIATSQGALIHGQSEPRKKLKENVEKVEQTYNNLLHSFITRE